MKPVLTQVRCPVRECGAIVLVAEIDGRRIALNPTWMEVAIPDGEGHLRLTRGLMPHGATCVDISARQAPSAIRAEG